MDKIPNQSSLLIAGTNVLMPDAREDQMFWGATTSGLFSVKSAYETLNQQQQEEPKEYWQYLWKLQVPARVKTFLWLTTKKALMTNSHRFRRNIASNPSCDLCTGREEDWIHVLRNCPVACMVWSELNPLSNLAGFLTMNLDNWLVDNIRDSTRCADATPWNVRFSISCWLLWRWRNERIFTCKIPFRKSAQICSLSKEFFRVFQIFVGMNDRQQSLCMVSW